MTKILQINVAANWGSHGRIVEGIGQVVQANGWESYIAYGRYANPSSSHLIRVETSSNSAFMVQSRSYSTAMAWGLVGPHAS